MKFSLFRRERKTEEPESGETRGESREAREGEGGETPVPGEEEVGTGKDAAAVADGSGGRADAPDFFEMSPEEAAGYKPPGMVIAKRKPLNLKPLLKGLGLVAVVGAIVVAIVFLWPSSTIKVPDLTGKRLGEAIDGARALGFDPVVKEWQYSQEHDDGVVIAQNPTAKEVVKKGSSIAMTVSKGSRPGLESGFIKTPAGPTPESGEESEAESDHPFVGKTVCLDPGLQRLAGEEEWVDPGMNRKYAGDIPTRGIVTGNPEYLITMDIGVKVQSLLEKDGINVAMTRESHDVNLTNMNRAEIANNADSDLCVRIHLGDSSDGSKNGTSTLYPAKTEWTESIYEASKTAALYVQEEVVRSCSTKDLGEFDGHDLPGFNWSKVPVIEVQAAYLSNPDEDALMATDDFRWKIAWGIRNGIIQYFNNS